MFDVKVLGTKVGTAEGFDTIDSEDCQNFQIQYYDFVPAEGVNLPGGMLNIDYITGQWTLYNEQGTAVTQSGKLEFHQNV